MGPIPMTLLLCLALGTFGYIMNRRLQPLLVLGAASDRFSSLGSRIQGLFVYGFGQKRMIDDPIPGLMHIFVFIGFLAVSLRTVTMIIRGFSADFVLPGFGGALGHAYLWMKDVFEVLVIIGVLAFLWRRLVTQPKRITLSGEAVGILCIIFSLMITDFIYDGALIATGRESGVHPPVGTLVAGFLGGLSPDVAWGLGVASFWIHCALVLGFLNLLPLSKHFHVITALPNILFRRISEPKGHLSKIDLEKEGAESFGLATLKDLSWKQALDLYTCTECGRCTSNCPANLTGKLLSPKQISINLRNTLYQGEMDKKLPGDVIPTQMLWACTSCRACEESCPVFIEYVDRIIDMRRELVLVEGEFPQELVPAFNGIERSGNPWGFSQDDRAEWAKGLGVKQMADVEERVDYLFWVGCSGSYDDRNKKVSQAIAKIMNAAGCSYAILGREESCTGDPARRAGNEYLFQAAAGINAATLNGYRAKFGKVVTACPHCFNTLKNEYPDFGLEDVPIIHHSELISDLVSSGKVRPDASASEKIVFHDPCYLGRYNDKYDDPRAIIDAAPNAERTEVERSGRMSRCCGAGGARMFMEENEGTRMNEARFDDLAAASPDTIAVGCPFCMTMLQDAVVQKGKGDTIRVRDLAEIVADRLPQKSPSNGVLKN